MELERELELAKEREREYQNQRQEIQEKENRKNGVSSPNASRPKPVPPKPSYSLSSIEQERRLLRKEWHQHNDEPPKMTVVEEITKVPRRPLPDPTTATKPPRPLPERPSSQATSPRPLPDPTAYANQGRESRVDRFLSSNPPPTPPKPATHRPQEYSTTAEVDAENSRRDAAQQKTRAGGWASKSLLEREMERERERQREWEENQKEVKAAAEKGHKDPTLGSGPGQGAWSVNQYGYLGGDNQNRVGPGLGIGGRRQIVGPRPKGL